MREQVVWLLDHYFDLFWTDKGGGGDGEFGVLLPSHDWRRCGQPLHEALVKMRDLEPELYRHTNGYYIACVWVTKDVEVERRTKKGGRVKVTQRQRVRRPMWWVEKQKSDRGVDWLTKEMSGRIRLPREVMKAA